MLTFPYWLLASEQFCEHGRRARPPSFQNWSRFRTEQTSNEHGRTSGRSRLKTSSVPYCSLVPTTAAKHGHTRPRSIQEELREIIDSQSLTTAARSISIGTAAVVRSTPESHAPQELFWATKDLPWKLQPASAANGRCQTLTSGEPRPGRPRTTREKAMKQLTSSLSLGFDIGNHHTEGTPNDPSTIARNRCRPRTARGNRPSKAGRCPLPKDRL